MRSEHSPEPTPAGAAPGKDGPKGERRLRTVTPEDEERGQQTEPDKTSDRDD